MGDLVTLDGRNSYDLDGDPLTYAWSVRSLPAGSSASLTNPNSVNPTFIPDLPGTYTFDLVVNDGKLQSASDDTLVIAVHPNVPPTANAGPDQSAVTGSRVALDGRGSSDPDGDPLSYHWQFFSRPAGSTAALDDLTSPTPSFTADLDGEYILQLTVNDGKAESTPDDVWVIASTPNAPPVANPGIDQTVSVQAMIALDGTQSYDPEGKPLTYRWSIVSQPVGSIATLDDPASPTPHILADKLGSYVFELIVNDGKLDSLPQRVVVTVVNDPPIANAGPDQTVFIRILLTLDGSGSSDPNGDPLTYRWTLVATPAGSSAVLNDSTSMRPTFTPDRPGSYTFQLVVHDGTDYSKPDLVSITAQLPLVTVPDVVGLAQAAAEAAIVGANLTEGTITTAHSATVPAGSVISQSPVAGTSVAEGSFIDLTTSLGPESAPLPPDPADVAPPLDLTVATDVGTATTFLYTGTDPIQTGVAPGTIEGRRAAVLRGKVLTRDGAALTGVSITILNHPEYGQTLSRADGMFDMAINGGGLITVKYEKTGYLQVQRQIDAPWQDYAWMPDVVMIPADSQVTPIDLTAPGDFSVARGSVQTDNDGTRQATLLFSQGTTAQMVMPDGSTQPLTRLSVRATEYTVGPNGPQAMPAGLPPTSGYTYAVELSVDEAAGATEVRFDRPVYFYVENFLKFPTGGIVPVGYYDRMKGQWVPSKNGRIIKILSVTNGLADLDIDGSGQVAKATALTALGITDVERQQLAMLYPSGQSLWRVPITHFTPWDCNWPYAPPPDAKPPDQPSPEDGRPMDDPCKQSGSIIECENQILGEAIDITGTPFRLHYQSDWVPGRKAAYMLNVPLSGASVPESLLKIYLEIYVAGQRFTKSFLAPLNQSYTFIWDGRDAYGHTLQGEQPVTVRIGYVYGLVYTEPAQMEESFAAVANSEISFERGRQDIISWQEWHGLIGTWDTHRQGLGGWSLNVHHVYAPAGSGRVLYQGDGERRREDEDNEAKITTVAGNGTMGYSGDGGLATLATLWSPTGVAVGPDGSRYIADTSNARIRRVGPDGIITTIAGNGTMGYSGDGGLATLAKLRSPIGVAVGPDGSLYIADAGNNRIRRVRPDGIITTVAGNSLGGYSGDGWLATLAGLSSPTGVAVGPDGSLYIADMSNNRIRRVRPDGIITTVAGNGSFGYWGDGGLATLATLYSPYGVAVSPDGSLYIADASNNRIRRVRPDGIITTVAGNGTMGYSGDGGLATLATLWSPYGVAVSPDGSLYIADKGNHRIRRVRPDGIITTVAGNGTSGYSGDGGLATLAKLSSPIGVAVGPDGSLYIGDTRNNRIRRVGASIILSRPSSGEVLAASKDGSEVYTFTSSGRHLRTLDAFSGSLRYQFTYDNIGRLSAVTDAYNNTVTIERDGSGNPTAIVAPGGQRTGLTLDANGYLASITNPAGEAVQLTYTPDGLLTSLTAPRGNVHSFHYDDQGRLSRDEDPDGGLKTLSRTDTANGYTVALTTGLNHTTTYQVENLSTGDLRRVTTLPSGQQTVTLIKKDGSRDITTADGTHITMQLGPDPRWGMQAPVTKSRTITTPEGKSNSVTAQRVATLVNPDDPLSLKTLTDTVSINGRTYTRTYDAATRKITTTSPAGRQTVTYLDALGKVTQVNLAPGLDPITFTYDTQGRLEQVTQGTQFWKYTYDAKNRLSTKSDATGNQIRYDVYDDADRVIQVTLPSGKTYTFTYDASGNRKQVIMPSGATHGLDYTAIDQDAMYTPPGGSSSYAWVYDIDRALDLVTLPGGRTVDWRYDNSGRFKGLSYQEAMVDLGYNDATGHVASISRTPTVGAAQSMSYSYDGIFVTGINGSGVAQGNYSYTYDNNFFLRNMDLTSGIEKSAIALSPDTDGLITTYGPFNFTRGGPAGAVSQISDGTLSISLGYDTLGRLASRTHTVSDHQAYQVQFTYNNIGVITQKIETVLGTAHIYDYKYDLDGQLKEVKRDGTIIEIYTYDDDGNRQSRTLGSNPTQTATYDSIQKDVEGHDISPL